MANQICFVKRPLSFWGNFYSAEGDFFTVGEKSPLQFHCHFSTSLMIQRSQRSPQIAKDRSGNGIKQEKTEEFLPASVLDRNFHREGGRKRWKNT